MWLKWFCLLREFSGLVFILHLIFTKYCRLSYFSFLSFFFFFLFRAISQHMEVPRLWNQSELQLDPTPQPQQREIQAKSAIYAAASDSLIHWARLGIEPESSGTICQVLDLLSYDKNSFFMLFWFMVYFFLDNSLALKPDLLYWSWKPAWVSLFPHSP